MTISLIAALSDGRDDRHAGFDAVHAGFRQRLGDADLFVLGEDDAGLLFAVAQSDVMNLDVLRELEVLGDLRRIIPLADEPVVRFPRLICHSFTPLAWVVR